MIITSQDSKDRLNSKDVAVIVRQSGSSEVVNVQELNKSEKYIVGKYDLEILTKPSLKIENVEVGQSATTTIEIPQSGQLTLNKGKQILIGSIFVKDSEETKWVCNLEEGQMIETLSLLPGQYMVVVRAKNATDAAKTQIKEFKIESKKTTSINLAK